MFGWLLYFLVVLVASLAVGRHLGRFRESCTEMTGMMAGMTIGMLGGFALGYGMTAAAGRDLFVGNLTGVLLGAALGGWFGRTGGLMGIMDGSMGGVMGGSMGAMIAAMVFPNWALNWTGVLFGSIYVVGCGALVALIESRSPEQEASHWLLPKLARIRPVPRRVQASGKAKRPAGPSTAVATSANSTRTATARVSTISAAAASTTPAAPMQDYYALLGVPKDAGVERIEEAYLDLLAGADGAAAKRADRALTTLSNPERRAMYDAALAKSLKRQPQHSAAEGRGDCCPPPKKKEAASPAASSDARTTSTPITAASASQPTRAKSPVTSPAPVTNQGRAASAPLIPGAAREKPRYRESSNAAFSASAAGANQARGSASANQGGSGRGSKQKQAQQAGTAKHGGQTTYARANQSSKNGRNDRNRYDRSYKDGRTNGYYEPGLSFGRRLAIGMTAVAAVAFVGMLLLYLSTVNSGSSAQAAGYLNQSPAGAAYHVGGAIPSEAQLESQAVAATVGADGVQTADLVLDQASSSYKPAAIKVKKGVPVRLNVTVEGSSRDCRSVVRLSTLGAQALTQPGQAVPMSFTPAKAGVYEFNCPMRMMNSSYLVVTD